MMMLGICLAAAGCREEEQGRPMVQEKGAYAGPEDEKLDDEQRSTLRSRTAGQRF